MTGEGECGKACLVRYGGGGLASTLKQSPQACILIFPSLCPLW